MPGLVEKFKEMWAPSDDYYEDEYEEENYEEESPRSRYKEKRNSSSGSRVVSIHATAKLKVVLTKPERFCEEVKTYSYLIRENKAVKNIICSECK